MPKWVDVIFFKKTLPLRLDHFLASHILMNREIGIVSFGRRLAISGSCSEI